MVSSYLKLPLRTLEQALDDRAGVPGTRSAKPAGANLTGPGSVELLVRLLTENTDQDGAIDQQPPLNRRHAA